MNRTTPISYLGVIIWRDSEPGYKLRYTARTRAGDKFAADTLAGIKALIREAME